MDHRRALNFPTDIEMSDKAKNLITAFLTDRTDRLGRNGVNEIKSHSFFKNDSWSWDSIRNCKHQLLSSEVVDLLKKTFDSLEQL